MHGEYHITTLTLARRGESADTGVLRSGESGGVGEKGGGSGEMELHVLTDMISSLPNRGGSLTSSPSSS